MIYEQRERRTMDANCFQLFLEVVLELCLHHLLFILLLLKLIGQIEQLLFVFLTASVQRVHVLRRRYARSQPHVNSCIRNRRFRLKPNTHRRRRRDETVESRRVGGVYTNSQLVGDSFVVSSV